MFKTIAASLLALSLATSLSQAASIFHQDTKDGEGGVYFPNPDSDGDNSNPADGLWDLPERGPTIEINPDYELPPRPVLDHHNLSLDFGLTDGGPVSYEKLARLNVNLSLSCSVSGTPVEFPDDILIANTGLIEIPVGTQIIWQTKAPKLQGTAILARTLKPGKSVKLNGVLAGGVSADTPCIIKAIGA